MKFQQKTAISLCALYLISIIGIAISMHFCEGKLSSVRLAETTKCTSCKQQNKVKESQSCCKTTIIDAKIKDSHEGGFKVRIPQNYSIELFLGAVLTNLFKNFLPVIFHRSENKAAPPRSAVLSLYIYNCVFRN